MKARRMKASELRLNNYVLEDGQVVLLSTNYDLFKCLVNVDRGIGFEPIPLTEEWLLKFGFEFYKKQVSLNVGGELFNYAVKNEIIIWTDLKTGWTLDGRTNRKTHWLNSVHQLQNLYFALTGEELTILS
jgi:hypothetical protein